MEYRIIRLLGQGKFGEVFLAKYFLSDSDTSKRASSVRLKCCGNRKY
jgi:serine/threonine protein kinase